MRRLLILAVLACAAFASAERAIEKSVTVPAPPAEVWKLWATTDGMRTFLSPTGEIELKQGGKYHILFDAKAPWGEQGSEGCQVLSWIPERMLSFTWNAPPSFAMLRQARTFVVLTFAPEGNGTRVGLRHAGWGEGKEWDDLYAYFDKAWGSVMEVLKTRVERGPFPAPVELKPMAAPTDMPALAELRKMVGGVWRGNLGTKEKPFIVEFRYRNHPDGVGVIGEGTIGKNQPKPVHVRNQFGIDPVTRSVYYLDSHNSGTVYWGHVAMEKDMMVFLFGPVGGSLQQFASRSRLVDKDTYQAIIRDKDGNDVVGFTLKRERR